MVFISNGVHTLSLSTLVSVKEDIMGMSSKVILTFNTGRKKVDLVVEGTDWSDLQNMLNSKMSSHGHNQIVTIEV